MKAAFALCQNSSVSGQELSDSLDMALNAWLSAAIPGFFDVSLGRHPATVKLDVEER